MEHDDNVIDFGGLESIYLHFVQRMSVLFIPLARALFIVFFYP